MRFIFLLILTIVKLDAQVHPNFEITYTNYVLYKNIDSLKLENEFKKAFIKETSKRKYFNLHFINNKSEFIEIPKINNDTQGNITFSAQSIQKRIIKNHDEETILYEVNFPKKMFVEDSLSNLKWKINKEVSDTVLNFITYKATLDYNNEEIIALYTPKIPIPEGPSTFYGLPGLILRLEIHRGNEIHIYEIEKIEKLTDKLPIIKINKNKIITVEEYKVLMDEFQNKLNDYK